MTTIAYKDGVLACDKQVTDGSSKYRGPYKLQVRQLFAYAITGEIADGLEAVDCIERGEPGERPEGDYKILQMDLRTGQAWEWEDTGSRMQIVDKIWAAGSGGDVAIGAMSFGASPEEAVKCASAWDAQTGFGVQVVRSERAQRRLKGK